MTFQCDLFRMHEPQPERVWAITVLPENIEQVADALSDCGFYTELKRAPFGGDASTALLVGQPDHGQSWSPDDPPLIWSVIVKPLEALIDPGGDAPYYTMPINEFRTQWRKHLGHDIDMLRDRK